MAKIKDRIQVDEEKIKMMMAGEIPRKADPEKDVISVISSGDSETKSAADIPPVTKQEDSDPDIQEMAKNRRKRSRLTYSDIFLCRPEIVPRRASTIQIDEENYRQIMRVIKTTDNFSIAGFINNVLAHHFEQYGEQIDEIVLQFIN